MERIKIKFLLIPCLILFFTLYLSNLANAQATPGPEEQAPSPPNKERIGPKPLPRQMKPQLPPGPSRRGQPVPPKPEYRGQPRGQPSKPGDLERRVRDLERRVKMLEQRIN